MFSSNCSLITSCLYWNESQQMSRYGTPTSDFNRLSLGRPQAQHSAGMVTTRSQRKQELSRISAASGRAGSARSTPVASSSRVPAQTTRGSRRVAPASRASRPTHEETGDDDDDDDDDDDGSGDGSGGESDDEQANDRRNEVYEIFSTIAECHHTPREFAPPGAIADPPPVTQQRQV